MKPALLFNRFFWAAIILGLICSNPAQTTARAENIKTIAVIPFAINSVDDLSHIQNGIVYMLYSRLSWPGNVVVVPKKNMEVLLSKTDNFKKNKLIHEIVTQTNSDFILSGSITELAGSFSIDARVLDIKNKQFMTFFEQSKRSDDLIEKVDRIAASINKKVFNRATVTYEKMEQEKQAHINELKRKNPEHMMNVPSGWQREESPGWKIWKYLF